MNILKDDLGWDEGKINHARKTFSIYDEKLKSGEEVNWVYFEHILRDDLGIGYQIVKSVILEFYDNDEFVNVCKGYASVHDVMEFKHINNA